jgi:ribose-phosphate pyrophosphokinase
MYILGGTSATLLSNNLSRLLNQPILKTTFKRFPDDEFYVRIEEPIDGEDVLIVQTAFPDAKIVELLIMQDAVCEAGARKISVVLPYFGYSRQDKKFEEGEAISARAMAEHISIHADEVITVDPHKEHILDFFTTPARSCSAVPAIAEYLKTKNIDLVLAPDKGAKDRGEEAAHLIGCPADYLEKTRIDGNTVKIHPKNLDVHGKTVAIVDDIISTGGTMANSIKELRHQGAKKIYVACTHGLFAGQAKEKLKDAGVDEIIATDTIESEFSKVSVAPCLASLLVHLA